MNVDHYFFSLRKPAFVTYRNIHYVSSLVLMLLVFVPVYAFESIDDRAIMLIVLKMVSGGSVLLAFIALLQHRLTDEIRLADSMELALLRHIRDSIPNEGVLSDDIDSSIRATDLNRRVYLSVRGFDRECLPEYERVQ